MLVSPINNSQNFQARIKINKSKLTKIVTTTGLGTTATAALAAQTDYDLGCIAGTVAAANHAQEPSYKGITLPLINAASNVAQNEDNGWLDSSVVLGGVTGQVALGSQLVGSAGYNMLDKMSNNKLSETSNHISFNLGKEKRQELAMADAATVGLAGLMAIGGNLEGENLATLGTTASTVGVWNTAEITNACDKTNLHNKKLPS
jgi:hypothetical protein